MSFLSSLPREFEAFGVGSEKREDERYLEYSGRRDSQPPPQPYCEPYSSAPRSYQTPPLEARAATPMYSPPHDKPPIPDGWEPQWDDHYQRWFYHDTTTGRSQWEAPGYIPPRPPMTRAEGRSVDSYHSYGRGGDFQHGREKKKSGHGGVLLGAAGGLAAGALVSHTLDDDSSDDEYHSYLKGAPVQQPAYAGSVSSSDSEDEARREYQEAVDDAASSSAGSSDREYLEEVREEYYSEQEEAYGSD